MTDRTQAPPLLASLGAALLALGLGYGACVEDKGVDAQTMATRDLLGLGPSWFIDMPKSRRDDLQADLEALAVEQAAEGAAIDLFDDADGPPPEAATPRRALSALDERLDTMDRPPILLQWAAYADPSDLRTPTAAACPITAEDFKPAAEDGQSALSWDLHEDFERPIDPAAPAGRTELDALKDRLPLIERWVVRCAEAAGEALAPEGALARIEIVRAKGAPALMSFWPQGRRVYLNPAVLALWTPEVAPDPTPRLRAQAQTREGNPYDLCLDDTLNYCTACDTPVEVERNACPSPLFPEGDALSDCQAVTGVPDGIARFCINQALFDFGDGLRQCILGRTGFDEACTLGDPATSAAELIERFATFTESPDCITALRACVDPGDPEPEPEFNPPINEPEFNPEPSDFPDDDDDCADDCASGGCDLGLEILCAGLTDCDDSDSSGDSGGGCEGDGGDSGGGCEGDSASSGGEGCCEGAE